MRKYSILYFFIHFMKGKLFNTVIADEALWTLGLSYISFYICVYLYVYGCMCVNVCLYMCVIMYFTYCVCFMDFDI